MVVAAQPPTNFPPALSCTIKTRTAIARRIRETAMNLTRFLTITTMAALLLLMLPACRSIAPLTYERIVTMPKEGVGAPAIDAQNASGSVEVRVDPRFTTTRVEWFVIGQET